MKKILYSITELLAFGVYVLVPTLIILGVLYWLGVDVSLF